MKTAQRILAENSTPEAIESEARELATGTEGANCHDRTWIFHDGSSITKTRDGYRAHVQPTNRQDAAVGNINAVRHVAYADGYADGKAAERDNREKLVNKLVEFLGFACPDVVKLWYYGPRPKMESLIMEEKLIAAGVKNLQTFGYPGVSPANILTDDIYKALFGAMLKENRGRGGPEVDLAIDALLEKVGGCKPPDHASAVDDVGAKENATQAEQLCDLKKGDSVAVRYAGRLCGRLQIEHRTPKRMVGNGWTYDLQGQIVGSGPGGGSEIEVWSDEKHLRELDLQERARKPMA